MRSTDYSFENYRTALKEHDCIVDCALEALDSLKDGELEEVDALLRDAQKSVAHLKRLKREKQSQDSMVRLLMHLKSIGVDFEIIQKRYEVDGK